MADTGGESAVQDLKHETEGVKDTTLRSQSCNGTTPEDMPSSDTPDLRSILVTSVLNLETLDADLYRLHYL